MYPELALFEGGIMKTSGYIIVEGNIGAGKSTFAQALANAFQALGHNAEYLAEPADGTNPFLPLYYEDPKRWAFTMQAHLLSKRYEMTQYAQHGALMGRGWFIMDRSYFGDLYFANVQMKDGYFTPDEYASYVSLHKAMQANIHYPTAAIFLDCAPKTCKRRIEKRMSERAGRACECAIDLGYLKSLDDEIVKLSRFMSTQTSTNWLAWDREREPDEIAEVAREAAEVITTTDPCDYSPWGDCAKELFQCE